MTRVEEKKDEILDWLYRLRSNIGVYMPREWCMPMVRALDVTIKALEQEPCEDCISRQAVLAIAGDSCLDLDSYEDTKDFCDEINELPPVTPQEQFKPMVEIDLYSVVKQKYIEREVLDKIRSEIEEIETYDGLYVDRAYVLQIIDKYKAESENKDDRFCGADMRKKDDEG